MKLTQRFRVAASHLSTRIADDEARKTVRIGRRNFTVFGAPGDEYFQTLQVQIETYPALMRYATAHLEPDSVVLDVGANIGLTALMLCSLVPRGHVYAIEASPINVDYLRRNLAANGLTNCTVIETAVGNEAGELLLHTSGAGSHIMTNSHMYQEEWASIKVPVVTIDQMISALPVARIDLIKWISRASSRWRWPVQSARSPGSRQASSWNLIRGASISPIASTR